MKKALLSKLHLLGPACLVVLAILGLFLLLHGVASVLRPRFSEKARPPTDQALLAEAARKDFRAGVGREPPVFVREVDYAEGITAPWYPREESPLLAGLVKEGLLPAVAERVGSEPLVLEGPESPGKYGGTWMRIATSEYDARFTMEKMLASSTLVRWSPEGYPIVPNIAKSWASSADRRQWTFHLRRGLRWSDGFPVSSEDIIYFFRDHCQKRNARIPESFLTRGQPPKVEAIDEWTVRFTFAHPHPFFLEFLTFQQDIIKPSHFLRPYHPLLGDKAKIDQALASTGLPDAEAFYREICLPINPETPSLSPWIARNHKTNPPYVYVRNPYYFAVDTQGRQLPYIERIVFEVKASNLVPVAASSGSVSMQARHLKFQDYTLLKSEEKRGQYRLLHWDSDIKSMWTIWPNLNRRVEPGDLQAAQKALLLDNKTFRQALSLAIDRNTIIRAVYSGVGTPSQAAPTPGTPFARPDLAGAFVEYDPSLANALLDSLGLTKRDEEGLRTFPDGSRMSWYLSYTELVGEGPAQFVIDDWAAVGIRAISRERSRSLNTLDVNTRQYDFTVWSASVQPNPMVNLATIAPVNVACNFAKGYTEWYLRGNFHDPSLPLNPRMVVPPEGHPILDVLRHYDAALHSLNESTQQANIDAVWKLAAENVWTISVASAPPQLAIVQNGFRNVPEKAFFGYEVRSPTNLGMELFYFDQSLDSPGAIEQTIAQLRTLEPRMGAATGNSVKSAPESSGFAFWLKIPWILATSGLLILGWKHPYIGRRLLIMIPTLLVISLVVFIIIQLPPGNFIENRILELEMQGDPGASSEAERLRKAFDLDKPAPIRYLEWLGLKWFVTFAKEDLGLLQGNLGLSMEGSRSVNEMVGDRILLTFLISLGSVLFTYAVAMPIGIYSAVRQYSLGDYLFTLAGFLGMCTPSFLLAIILIYVGKEWFGLSMTGLFSPEFAVQPEWDWPKLVDLLQHIWVPVLIMGISGTAGMIRVMRGNLLDELKKPYVVTARAKGVSPLRLLIKYPVRVALNPFVSGIGGLFPSLVSGGAIVAMVLSLPTVGPLMLHAILTEDTYLAGSMLMVLSSLSVMGTLVSDMLLLWLDPRIRYEGGSR